jgi:hypothetical protein
VKAKIAGVVTYGDTQNQQDNGQIPNFPRDKVLVICNTGDLVCRGTLTIALPHCMYNLPALCRVIGCLLFFINQQRLTIPESFVKQSDLPSIIEKC